MKDRIVLIQLDMPEGFDQQLTDAIEWCETSRLDFIKTAIQDRLAEVQAAMGEEA